MAAEVRMGQLNADFGKTAVDYGKHRAGFPSELFDRLAAMGIGRAGARTLDLGTGTGTIARSLAQQIQPFCRQFALISRPTAAGETKAQTGRLLHNATAEGSAPKPFARQANASRQLALLRRN